MAFSTMCSVETWEAEIGVDQGGILISIIIQDKKKRTLQSQFTAFSSSFLDS